MPNAGCTNSLSSHHISSCDEGKVFDFDANPFQFNKSCTEDETKPANDDFSLSCEPNFRRYRRHNCSVDTETVIYVVNSEVETYGKGEFQHEYIDSCCEDGHYYDDDSGQCEDCDENQSECD